MNLINYNFNFNLHDKKHSFMLTLISKPLIQTSFPEHHSSYLKYLRKYCAYISQKVHRPVECICKHAYTYIKILKHVIKD